MVLNTLASMRIIPEKIILVIPSDMFDMMTKHSAKSYQLEEEEI